MDTRGIPPLSQSTLTAHPDLSILNTNMVIRHGARTPYKPYNCWSSYLTSPENSKYDCSTTMLMAPFGTDHHVLFNKKYDALEEPLTNLLGGSCHVGQLIEEGAAQEATNGGHIRSAYITTEQSSLKLFRSLPSPPIQFTDLPYARAVRARGDDQQRTLMSGQILITGIFDFDNVAEAIIDYHTADYDADPIYPNSKICPKLSKLRDDAIKSGDFVNRNTSSAVRSLTEILTGPELGYAPWDHILDCQYTTICNDRPLPDVLNDFTSEEDRESVFNKMIDHSTWELGYVYTYNDAAFSKLAMAPLFQEILDQLQTASRFESQEAYTATNTNSVINLFSGHDTTIMPVLAALKIWDGVWAPYASLIVIETFASEGKHFFRIVYNGKVLTANFEGCSEELCELSQLINYLSEFATSDRDCAHSDAFEDNHYVDVKNGILSGGSFSDAVWVFIVILCSSLASYMTWRFSPDRNNEKYGKLREYSKDVLKDLSIASDDEL